MTREQDVEKKINDAKIAGHQGIWIYGLETPIIRKLESQGCCITHGVNNWTEEGDDRRNQTWVFWG